MPVNSINTNVSALIALQQLNRTNTELDEVQGRISTGLRVTGPVDDASSFSIAQGIRADLKAYEAISQGIANAKGVTSIALSAATSISDLLGDIRRKITEGMNAANTSGQQSILQADFENLIGQVNTFISNAEFNGRNLLSAASTNVGVISNIDGTTLTIRNQSVIQTSSVALGTQSISSTATATTALTFIQLMEQTVAEALGRLGADTRSINFQDEFVSVLSDATTTGLGTIVDADLAKESARLQAVQVKQQLGTQTLNIANQRPNILLQLFQ